MKEFNVNIEGYNENGVCVSCLNYGKEMYYFKELRYYYSVLANIEIPCEMKIRICFMCSSDIHRIKQFIKGAKESFKFLLEYSRKHRYIDSYHDFDTHSLNRLTVCKNESISFNSTAERTENSVETSGNVLETSGIIDHLESKMVVDIKPVDIKSEVKSETIEEDYTNSDNENLLSLMLEQDDYISEAEGGGKTRRYRSGKLAPTPFILERKAMRKKDKRKTVPLESTEIVNLDCSEVMKIREQDLVCRHYTGYTYGCRHCVLGFTDKLNWSKHMKRHDNVGGENSVQCQVCQLRVHERNYSVHLETHSAVFSCKRCDYRTTARNIMKKHIKEHSSGEHVQANLNFKCRKCGLNFDTRSKLSYHRNKCESSDRYQCDCCGKVFASKPSLKIHLRTKMGMNAASKHAQNDQTICKYCNKVFKTSRSYRAHVVIHESSMEHPCPTCGKLFKWQRNLARHLRGHRERGAYGCQKCGVRFASKESFEFHLKFSKKHLTDEDMARNKCEVCGKTFVSRRKLLDHIDWDHNKKVKYRCAYCHKALKSAKILQAHINNIHLHKNKKETLGQHLCHQCGKYYTTEKRLKCHIWAIHKNRNKTYKCSYCPATFLWSTSVYKHVKMTHGAKRTEKGIEMTPSAGKQSNKMYQYQYPTSLVTS